MKVLIQGRGENGKVIVMNHGQNKFIVKRQMKKKNKKSC